MDYVDLKLIFTVDNILSFPYREDERWVSTSPIGHSTLHVKKIL